MAASPLVNLYPLSNYTFDEEELKTQKHTCVADRLAGMKESYKKEGMRTSVEGVLLVHENRHPHVLLLQFGQTSIFYQLPGGRLQPGENEIEGLKRKLTSKLGTSFLQHNWQIGERVAIWWRPNFENAVYPYCPPHITRPKECKKLFIVQLSERDYFSVPINSKLIAVPFFDLYDNGQRYGPIISSIPEQLSRFPINMLSA